MIEFPTYRTFKTLKLKENFVCIKTAIKRTS